MNDPKNARGEERLEKAAREASGAVPHYEIEAAAIREKTARLKALRLAKEAADREAAGTKPARTARASKPTSMRRDKKAAAAPLSQWLAEEENSGRRR